MEGVDPSLVYLEMLNMTLNTLQVVALAWIGVLSKRAGEAARANGE